MRFTVEVRGLEKMIAILGPQLIAKPLRDFLTRGAITIQGKARIKAPSDRGILRNGITYSVDPAEVPLWSKVGVNQGVKAKAMEFGTGTQSDATDSSHTVHFPPWGARNPELELWARRHGFPNGFLVARAIGRRGGIKPRRFMRDAVAESLSDLQRFGNDLLADIKAIWDSNQ